MVSIFSCFLRLKITDNTPNAFDNHNSINLRLPVILSDFTIIILSVALYITVFLLCKDMNFPISSNF
jgi:hypothetical protein